MLIQDSKNISFLNLIQSCLSVVKEEKQIRDKNQIPEERKVASVLPPIHSPVSRSFFSISPSNLPLVIGKSPSNIVFLLCSKSLTMFSKRNWNYQHIYSQTCKHHLNQAYSQLPIKGEKNNGKRNIKGRNCEEH